MTSSEVYWEREAAGLPKGLPPSGTNLISASPAQGMCLAFSVFSVHLPDGGKRASLLPAKVISGRFKNSAPNGRSLSRWGRETQIGEDWDDTGSIRALLVALLLNHWLLLWSIKELWAFKASPGDICAPSGLRPSIYSCLQFQGCWKALTTSHFAGCD